MDGLWLYGTPEDAAGEWNARGIDTYKVGLRADIGKRGELIRDMYDWGEFMNLPHLGMGKRIRELGIEVCI